jgi:hypothetical protein
MAEYPIVDLTVAPEPEVIDLPIPPEPPVKSVVLDRDNYAWQSMHPRDQGEIIWCRVKANMNINWGSHPHYKPWRHLVVDNGPLQLVHRSSVGQD